MKILLIAYDFPPIPSPQSLRWAYLVKELAGAGHEVHVLAPDVCGYGMGGLPVLPDTVRIHRVWPGPHAAFVRWRSQRRIQPVTNGDEQPSAGASPSTSDGATVPGGYSASVELNWKGRLRERVLGPIRAFRRALNRGVPVPGLNVNLSGLAAYFMYPDIRAEWAPWATRKLDALLTSIAPDVVVTSHEPANSITLGLRASSKGYRWVADLGDPLLAPYTPRRWRARAFRLERALCEQAASVTMTSESAIQSLRTRHPMVADRCHLLTQGFDQSFVPGQKPLAGGPSDHLDLLYTGSFYVFRDPTPLIHAVIDTPGVRLLVATIVAPEVLLRAAKEFPEKFVLLGFIAHKEALALQRESDVLLNIANSDPVQIPGKLYEYFGSGTPILHMSDSAMDASAELVVRLEAGWCVRPDEAALREVLGDLLERKRSGRLARPSMDDRFQQYSWKSIAERFAGIAGEGVLIPRV